MEGIRYANMGLAVGVPLLVIGGIVLRDNPEAQQAVVPVSFIITFAVYNFLWERAKRRDKR